MNNDFLRSIALPLPVEFKKELVFCLDKTNIKDKATVEGLVSNAAAMELKVFADEGASSACLFLADPFTRQLLAIGENLLNNGSEKVLFGVKRCVRNNDTDGVLMELCVDDKKTNYWSKVTWLLIELPYVVKYHAKDKHSDIGLISRT